MSESNGNTRSFRLWGLLIDAAAIIATIAAGVYTDMSLRTTGFLVIGYLVFVVPLPFLMEWLKVSRQQTERRTPPQ